MAYLAKAIEQVLPEVKAKKVAKSLEEKRERNQVENERRQLEQRLREEVELAEREEAFLSAFPSPEGQAETIAKYSKQFQVLGLGGSILRGLAIGAWWEGYKK